MLNNTDARKKLNARNSIFLARVRATFNAKIFKRAAELVNEVGSEHGADRYLSGFTSAEKVAEMHAPKELQATELNIYALRSYLKGGSDAQPSATDREFPNAIAAVDAPHIRRCLKAGLIETTGKTLRLTEKGLRALCLRPQPQLDAGITVAADGTVSVDGSELTHALGEERTMRCAMVGDRFDFSGGFSGGHSLDADRSCTTKARLVAHWNGYCSNNIAPSAKEAV